MVLWWGVMWGVMGAAPLPLAAVVQRNPASPVHAAVEEGLRRTLAGAGAYRVVPLPDTQLGLETARAGQWQCDGAPECMAQLSTVLGAPVLLDLECANTNAEGVTVVVRLLEGKQEKRRTQTWLPAVAAQQQAGLQRVVRALTQEHAELRVDAARGTPVCVDGECIQAQDPWVAWDGLAPGSHALVVKTPGAGMAVTVTVAAGHQTRVKVGQRGLLVDGATEPALPEAAAASTPKAPSAVAAAGGVLAATSLVGALAMAVLGAAAGALAYSTYSGLHRGPHGRLVATGDQTRAEVESARNRVVVGAVLSGGALAVGALLLVTAVAGLAGLGGGLVWSVVAS